MNYSYLFWFVVYQTLILPMLVWVGYLASMNLIGANDKGLLTKEASYPAYVIVGLTYMADIYLNLTTATVLFWDLPVLSLKADGTFSARLSGYNKQTSGKRAYVTKTILAPMFLDPFDPKGKHIS